MTRTLCTVVLLVLFLSVVSISRPAIAQRPVPSAAPEDQEKQNNPAMKDYERRRAKALNKQRQEDLKRDTDRLLQLATELKLDVDRSSENVLSLTVMKKAEEIEKLAKSVKDKMKGQ